MKKFGFTAVTAGALTAGALTAGVLGLAAPAMAAPTAANSPQDTINSLEAEGYDVIVNHLSTTPLDQASVVSVGHGQSFTHSVSGANTDGDKLYGPVTRNTVYVNVK